MDSFARTAVSSTKWVAFSQASRMAAQLCGVVILARLLSPADFGVVAMATVVIGFAHLFRDVGTAAAVIQRRTVTKPLLDSVFWLNIGIGLGLALLLAAIAPLIALAMREPRLTDVLRLLSLVFPILALGMVQQALLERESQFRPVAVIEVLAACGGLASAVFGALSGWGVYSLVAQTIMAAFVATAGLWMRAHWRPGRDCSLAELRQLVHFSGNLFGFNLLNYFVRNVDSVLVGRFLGATDLGFYTVAYRLMLWPLQNISWVAGRALFPALSRLQDDRPGLRQGYVQGAAAVFLVTAPLSLGLFVLREPFVLAVLGEGWLKVADLLFWLAPVAVVQSVGTTVGWLYLSTGRTDVMFKVAAAYSLAAFAALLVGLQWGVEGVAAAYCLSSFLLFWPSLAIPFRLVGLSLARFARRLAPTLVAACLMALCVAVAARQTAPLPLPPWSRLALLVGFGVAVYFVLSMFIQRALMKDVRTALFAR